MNDDLNRGLGNVEGQLKLLVDAVTDATKRVAALEKKVYLICGGAAVGGALLSKVDLGIVLTTIAKAAQ